MLHARAERVLSTMVLIKAWIVILIIELFEVLLILALERFDSLLPVAVIDGEEVV